MMSTLQMTRCCADLTWLFLHQVTKSEPEAEWVTRTTSPRCEAVSLQKAAAAEAQIKQHRFQNKQPEQEVSSFLFVRFFFCLTALVYVTFSVACSVFFPSQKKSSVLLFALFNCFRRFSTPGNTHHSTEGAPPLGAPGRRGAEIFEGNREKVRVSLSCSHWEEEIKQPDSVVFYQILQVKLTGQHWQSPKLTRFVTVIPILIKYQDLFGPRSFFIVSQEVIQIVCSGGVAPETRSDLVQNIIAMFDGISHWSFLDSFCKILPFCG